MEEGIVKSARQTERRKKQHYMTRVANDSGPYCSDIRDTRETQAKHTEDRASWRFTKTPRDNTNLLRDSRSARSYPRGTNKRAGARELLPATVPALENPFRFNFTFKLNVL